MKVLQKPVFIGVGIFLAGILLTGIVSRYYVSKTNEIAENIAESYMERMEMEQAATPSYEEIAPVTESEAEVQEEVVEEESEEVPEEEAFLPRSPVLGGNLTEYTGTKLIYSEILEVYRAHPGIDLRARSGEAVLSCEKGKVQAIFQDSLYGKTVQVDHGNGYVCKYANLSDSVNVQVGDTLMKGDLIGTVGVTSLIEAQDEPHLHFEVLKDGESMNPELFLSL